MLILAGDVDATKTLLGLFEGAVWDEETLQIEPGDWLVVFSDGVSEALNTSGEEFGESWSVGQYVVLLSDPAFPRSVLDLVTPEPIKQFIEAFDGGACPELESSFGAYA